MSVKSLWPTNVYLKNDAFVGPDLQELQVIGEAYECHYPEAHVPALMRTAPESSYNILDDKAACCVRFRNILDAALRELITAEGFLTPDAVEFEAVTNLRKFGPMEYAKPHVHRNSEYVAVLFLSLEITAIGKDCHQKMAGNRLHLIDPTPMRSRFLNHKMIYAINPVPGMLVIHPASIFHTTELNLSNSDLVALVTNVRVLDPVRNYAILGGASV